MRDKKRVVLIQMGPVHEELAPPFVDAFISLGFFVSVWLHPGSIQSKGDVFSAYSQPSYGPESGNFKVTYAALQRPSNQELLLEDIVQNNIKFAIFLTLQDEWSVQLGQKIVSLEVNITGIIHSVQKLRNPLVKKYWVNSVNSPIVLANHVAKTLNIKYALKSIVFNSVFYPELSSLPPLNYRHKTAHSRYRISILGGVNFDSRNYIDFLRGLSSLPTSLSHRLSFIIAGGGKDRESLIYLIESMSLCDVFEFLELDLDSNKVGYFSYYKAIADSDAVLVLPGPGYADVKITSALPSAISFCKPIIINSLMANSYELNDKTVSFSSNNITEAIVKLLQVSVDDFSAICENIAAYRDDLLKQNIESIRFFVS